MKTNGMSARENLDELYFARDEAEDIARTASEEEAEEWTTMLDRTNDQIHAAVTHAHFTGELD